MFRDMEDYHRGFNCFALALHKTGSTGLAEAIMATHTHQIVQTDRPAEFIYHFRRPYSLYFNHKYQRSGQLGEDIHFTMEVVGHHHLLAALSYVLRNALHHGVAPIPYAYPHCSANAFFRREMGKFLDEKVLPRHSCWKFLGRRAEFPGHSLSGRRGNAAAHLQRLTAGRRKHHLLSAEQHPENLQHGYRCHRDPARSGFRVFHSGGTLSLYHISL